MSQIMMDSVAFGSHLRMSASVPDQRDRFGRPYTKAHIRRFSEHDDRRREDLVCSWRISRWACPLPASEMPVAILKNYAAAAPNLHNQRDGRSVA
jgi:hypothetical protein